MKRLYIAGPMTGLPEFNYPAFNAEAARLRALGYHVENPAENTHPPSRVWSDYMRTALRQMLTCDAVVTLDGWSLSRGARIEVRTADELGMRIYANGDVKTPSDVDA